MRFISAFLWVASIAPLFGADPTPAADTRDVRPYRDGPLTAADFRARPPVRDRENPESQHSAWIRPGLEYKFQTRRKVDKDGVTLTLAVFEAEAAVARKQSWIREATDEVLEHEQGHLDVMQVIALEWTIQLRTAIAKGLAPQARRDTFEAASEELERFLRAQFADRIRQADMENDYYDTFTRHGHEAEQQAEYRDLQTRRIEQFQKQLKRK